MIDSTLIIDAPDGKMRVYSARPEGGDLTAVLLIPDVLGLHQEIKGFVRKIANAGYACFAPDLYYRSAIDDFPGLAAGPTMRALARQLMTNDLAEDLRAVAQAISAQSFVRADPRKGCIGFCRGGGQSLVAAGAVPDEFLGVVSVYGTRLIQDTPDTGWLRWAEHIKGELLFLAAGDDPGMPREDWAVLEEWLIENRKKYELRIFDDALHGWNFASRRQFNAYADSETWSMAFDLWMRTLG